MMGCGHRDISVRCPICLDLCLIPTATGETDSVGSDQCESDSDRVMLCFVMLGGDYV